MKGAFLVSAAFLCSYLYYHLVVQAETGPVRYNAVGWRRGAYLLLLPSLVLVLAVLLAADAIVTMDGESARDLKVGLGAVGALPVGLVVFAIGIGLGGTTGYAINPARDLGPRIAHAILPIPNKRDSDWSYAWIPVVGPVLGGVVAAAVYLTAI